VGCTLTTKAYPDQPIVIESGDLSSSKRGDSSTAISLGAMKPWRVSPRTGLVVGMTLQTITLDSNQNHYDARKLLYTPDYYDYTTTAAGMEAGVLIGKKPWGITVGATLSRQNYSHRLAQDTDGNYLAQNIYTDETIYTVNLVYPLSAGFKLRLIGGFIEARSNMKYEKTFAYNYQTSHYLMGFSYEF
jgi:hypothetical protein